MQPPFEFEEGLEADITDIDDDWSPDQDWLDEDDDDEDDDDTW